MPINRASTVSELRTLTKKVPERAWQKLSAGAGAKGRSFYDWTVSDLAEPDPLPRPRPRPRPGSRQLLIRRYASWSRWATPATLAYAFLAVVRAAEHARHSASDAAYRSAATKASICSSRLSSTPP